MNKYRNLQNCLDGASVIMDVVEEFELEGDFKAIEEILKLVRFYIIQLLLKYLLGLIYAIVLFLFLFSVNGFLRVILQRFSRQIAHRCFQILKKISLQFLVYGVSAAIP
jgi:fatty-acid desaturase